MTKETAVVFLVLFIKSVATGILSVLTPFIYAILPVTTRYLSPKSKPRAEGLRNTLLYALCLILIFTSIGTIISSIVRITGLNTFTTHWIFNFILFRLFAGLGISFLGAFELKLPSKWANPTASKAKPGSFRGIFFMALTFPIVSFSTMLPIVALVLLIGGKDVAGGSIITMFGFALGLSLPIIFPGMLNVFVKSKSLLNQIKVLLGFFSIALGLKFFSYADIGLGWNILDRDMFIIILMLLSTTVGLYMIGAFKLPKDYAPDQNVYGIEFVSMFRLFIAIALFTFVIYLLPGIWGAPLHGVSNFLPK
ncbi:MAG: hypothetical protein K9G49_12230 [Taibaiella sp.]|nr:hypothetical protein [Taibaiella sp.]